MDGRYPRLAGARPPLDAHGALAVILLAQERRGDPDRRDGENGSLGEENRFVSSELTFCENGGHGDTSHPGGSSESLEAVRGSRYSTRQRGRGRRHVPFDESRRRARGFE
ncbi:hypothetical protein VTO73DRAFT_11495 [Trametes versicolor]